MNVSRPYFSTRLQGAWENLVSGDETKVHTAAYSSHWLRLNGIYYILLMLWLSKRKLGLYTPINTVFILPREAFQLTFTRCWVQICTSCDLIGTCWYTENVQCVPIPPFLKINVCPFSMVAVVATASEYVLSHFLVATFPCCNVVSFRQKRRKLRSSQDLNLTTEPLELWHWSRGQMDWHR